MAEIIRTRDCIVFFYGDRQTVSISQAMVDGGWAGGQGVQWTPATADDRRVTYSGGLYGGFLVWGSDEPGDKFTAMTRQQPTYRYATMFSGGCLMATTTYERYTYASRVGGGPLIPLVYLPNDVLYLSLRGLWTKEDEMTLSGAPEAPAFYTGFVAQVPKVLNRYYLGIQTSMLCPTRPPFSRISGSSGIWPTASVPMVSVCKVSCRRCSNGSGRA